MIMNLWAKKSVSQSNDFLWLPLRAHLADAAAVAVMLWDQWLPEGVKKQFVAGIASADAMPMDDDLARQIFIFLAATHDLGKASPAFQAKKRIRAVGEVSPSAELDDFLHQGIRDAGLPLQTEEQYHNRAKTRHELISHLILRQHGFDESLAVVLGAHHGKPPNDTQLNDLQSGAYDSDCGFDNANWRHVQTALLNEALAFAGLKKKDVTHLKLTKPAQALFSALVILADWIASDEKLFPLIEPGGRMQNAANRANEAWDKLKLTACWDVSPGGWENLFAERFGEDKSPRPVQETLLHLMENCAHPGIVVVEAPMGEGKTEAALAAAEILAARAQRGGLFFALPSQATSNAMLSRVLDWMKKLDDTYGDAHSVLLAHGKADFNTEYQEIKDYRKIRLPGQINVGGETDNDEDGGIIVHEWLSGRKKGMLADFVIGTIDQLLLAGLKQKHVMLRHLGLANKVVIIDECHAYDVYMGKYLEKALNWLGAYRVPVIVLSATLPAARRQQVIDAWLNEDSTPTRPAVPWKGIAAAQTPKPSWVTSRAYPLITYTDGDEVLQVAVGGAKRSLAVTIYPLSDDELIVTLQDALVHGGCVGVMVNTVGRAQKIYQTLSDSFPDYDLRLLHSRFIAPDRAEKENKLRTMLGPPGAAKRPDRLIVVGTQVLEQSLDLDFDLLITDLCPIDLLIQRIGRLHRHQRSRPERLRQAVCHVLGAGEAGWDSGSEKIYGKYLLMRTKAFLPAIITLPGDIPALVQDVYDEERQIILDAESQAEYDKARAAQNERNKKRESRAQTFQIPNPLKGLNTLVNWLDTDIVDKSEQQGLAAVRDGVDAIEVIVFQKSGDDTLRFLPWIENGREIPRDQTPDAELARAMAACMVRLPAVFGAAWLVDKAISALERTCREERLNEWQKSPWLKGELFLILDDNFVMNLCDYRLQYKKNLGLISEKMEA